MGWRSRAAHVLLVTASARGGSSAVEPGRGCTPSTAHLAVGRPCRRAHPARELTRGLQLARELAGRSCAAAARRGASRRRADW